MNIEQFIKPISGDQPCGADVSIERGYGSSLDGVVIDITGAGGSSMVVAEKVKSDSADWNTILTRVGGFFKETKHLELAFFATLADVNLSGIDGLLDGLNLYKQLLVKYWNDVYPLVEESDGSDRLYQISRLNDYLLVESFLNTIVVKGRRPEDAYSISQLISSQEKGDPNPDFVNAAINEALKEQPDVFEESLEKLSKVEDDLRFVTEVFINEQLPGENVQVDGLKEAVKNAKEAVEKITNSNLGSGESVSENAANPSTSTNMQENKAAPLSGEIRNRDDVKVALEKVIRFYSRHEPTSPVPGLLKRAKRMVNMDFNQIVKELGLDQNRFESGQVFGESEEDIVNN